MIDELVRRLDIDGEDLYTLQLAAFEWSDGVARGVV
jgi:hypothetical protein